MTIRAGSKREVKPERVDTKLRRDFLAGTEPPYYGLPLDRLSLEMLAQGIVVARVQVRARQILDDEAKLIGEPT